VNLALTLLAAAERHGDGEAVVDGGERWDYATLHSRAASLAGGLAELGLEPGQPVCALLKNRREAVELYWATQWLGAWFVPLNFRLSPDEVHYCVRDCGAGGVVFEEASAQAAARCREPGRTLVALDDEGEEGGERGNRERGNGERGNRERGRGDGERGDVRLSEIADGSPPHPGALDLAEDEISLMLYTSGTTGKPKGVPRSHRADRAAGLSQVVHHGYRWADRSLGVMPIYHTMGMHTMIAMALIDGCFVALPDWDAGRAVRLIEEERISSLYLAPTLFHDLLGELPESADVSSVESIGYAGSPMSPELAARCTKAFGARVFFNHYGSTEYYTWAVGRDQASKPGCAGRPAINTRLRLVQTDDDASPDALVEPGEEGQVIADMRGDESFHGYWQRPDADEKAIRDGWYYPGDIAHLDEHGELWIVGRMDDMIISGGENIHPVEVENVLTEHPQVQEAAVIGAADERWGQRVVAFVVGEQLDEEDLDRHCRDSAQLANFKRPREYRLVDELPKSPTGKLLRRELRKEIES
jgi:2-furoate---CoA ligase